MPIIGWLHHADHALAPIWRSVTARADVDLELRNTAGEVTVLTRVSGDQSLDPNEDPGSTRSVLERVDPLGVLVSLVYPHGPIVAQRLRLSRYHHE
jgi:hypothetical protein